LLSYQHGFHAGNRADVLKHAVLDALLRDMATRRLLYIETHAGRGRYDLTGAQARKTGEADDGVLALLDGGAPAPLAPWLDLVGSQGPGAYPGSPALAGLRLGRDARMVFFEQHPREYGALTETLAGDTRAQAKKADGYASALRLKPRRGETMVVFADPSYETMADMEALSAWTPRALDRWPDAMVVVWLPLFKDGREEAFGAWLAELEDGIIAGARWRETRDKDTALEGSAIIAYRVSNALRREATDIATSLERHWTG